MEGGESRTGEVGTVGATRTGIATLARAVKLFLRVPKRKREVRLPLEVVEEREGLWEGFTESVSEGWMDESLGLTGLVV